MSIKKFITDALNIDPLLIESVDCLESDDESLTVFVRLKPMESLKCNLCGGPLISNGSYKKKLIHSTFINRSCLIIFDRRRYLCRKCEITVSEPNPFASPGDNVTYETKINVLRDLKETSFTYTLAARRNNISPTKVLQIFDKHVSISRKPLPEALSIDEHYFPASDFDSLYICILMDFRTGTIVDVLPDRKKEYLISYFSGIKNETLDEKTGISELSNVKYVSMDLCDTYKDIALTYFKGALICADSFHVIEHLVKDFRDVRLRCRRNTKDEDIQYLLVKFKYIFDHGRELDNKPKYNKRFRRYMNYRDMMKNVFLS